METLTVLNPYEILSIDPYATRGEIKVAFKGKICSSQRHQRAMCALAYDMLCSKDSEKYTRFGHKFIVTKKDHFYYVTTENYEVFQEEIRKQKSLLNRRDEHGRTLLYISARNGFHNICNFLLKSGCKINETQNCGSTALHAAAFYGHQSIVQMLLEYGANPEIRNSFRHSPLDEACTLQIRDCIRSKTDDKISTLLNVLTKQESVKNMVLIKYQDKIIGKKILRNPEHFPEYPMSYLTAHWALAWHGTKYNHLTSIMRYGLQAAGTVLSPEHQVSTQAGHIALHRKVGCIDNWANAVFVSPSIFYAADIVYSERIFSDNQRWCVLIETRVKPGSFTKHNQTLFKQRELLPDEPQQLEYRVGVKSDEDFILRVGSNRNVIVTALIFVSTDFLENIDEYYQGDLFANSEAERAFFQ